MSLEPFKPSTLEASALHALPNLRQEGFRSHGYGKARRLQGDVLKRLVWSMHRPLIGSFIIECSFPVYLK